MANLKCKYICTLVYQIAVQALISVLEGKLGKNQKSCRYLISVLQGIFKIIILIRKKSTNTNKGKSVTNPYFEHALVVHFVRQKLHFSLFSVSILKKSLLCQKCRKIVQVPNKRATGNF